MKSLLVVIDGLGDEKIPEFGNQTPFEYARHKYIDALEKMGTTGAFSICERDFPPESLKCILRLLGVKDKDLPKNRAYLELLAHNRNISEHEMVLRCNLISVDEKGTLLSSNAKGLTLRQMHEAAVTIGQIASNIEFIHLSGYRNLLIMDKEKAFAKEIDIEPPHESIGKNVRELLEKATDKSLQLKYLLEEAKKTLSIFNKGDVHYELYPWAISERSELPSFSFMHKGLKGAVVCAAEIVKGISDGLKMERPEINGVTGETDTDILLKAQLTLSLLKHHNFVFTHFNGADEAGHRKNPEEKAVFIERIDKEFFKTLLSHINEPLRILICGDHGTSSLTGKHLANEVPYVAGTLKKEEKFTITSYKDAWKFLFTE